MITFSNIINTGIFTTTFTQMFSAVTCDFFNFSTCNFTTRTNNKNEIFTGINFSQLILVGKTKIKDSGRAPPDLFFSLQQAAYKLT